MLRTLKTIVLPVLIGLAILALIGLTGSALFLYREAANVHPILGWGVAGLLLFGLVLLVVYPIVRLLRLPSALVRPTEPSGPRWDRFTRRYAQRLVKNPLVWTDYNGLAELEAALSEAAGSTNALEAEIGRALRYLDGRAQETIARHAAAVFTATAISQSGRLDAAVVISAQLRMVREIGEIYYQRPRPRELWTLYANVGASTFLAGEIQDSEVLAVLGAPVSASLAGLIPMGGADPLVSLLVNSLLDGSANAFLTLRVGAAARRYCGLRLEGNRRAITRSASVEAAGLLADVVGQGASRLATMTRKLILEGAVKSTSRTAKEMINAGTGLFDKIFGLAEKAKTAATESTARGLRFLQRSLICWETVASGGEDGPTQKDRLPLDSRPRP